MVFSVEGPFPTISAPPATEMLRTIEALKRGTVLILGDVMLDTYLSGDADRISPEAPVPVIRIEEERHVLGGAGNVARNVTALGGKALLLGMRGDDAAGERLSSLLKEEGIQAALHVHPSRPTTVKSRILARGQQMLRFDQELTTPFTGQEEDALLQAAEELLQQCQAIVVSDYNKGLVTPSFMQGLKKRLSKLPHPLPVLVDPKPGNINAYTGVTLMTPNIKETGELAQMPVHSKQDVVAAGRTLMRRVGCEHMLTTLGSDGMAVFETEDRIRRVPTVARKVFDVTGAGDTVIATIALALSAGISLFKASILANHAAGEVVGEIGAATCSNERLYQALEDSPTVAVEDWS